MKILIYLSIIVLTACSFSGSERVAPNYFQAFKAIKAYTIGINDDNITRELVDNIPYASIKLKIGKGPSGLLILEELQQENLVYISADNVRLMIKNGVIIRTSGFENNLVKRSEPKNFLISFLDSGKEERKYYIYHSYDMPKLSDLKIEATIKRLEIEEITILGRSYKLLRVEQILENKYLGWKRKNIFWVDPSDYFVWKSKQHISPLLPEINIEVTKKYLY